MKLRALWDLHADDLGTLPLAILYLTDKCNSKCIACDYWRFGQSQMPLEFALGLVRDLSACGTKYVLLSGGEPLQHSQWDLIAGSFKKAGVKVAMVTSGILLPKYSSRISDCIDELYVSLDGASPTSYEAIRGVDAFHQVDRGVRALAGKVPITIRTTVQRLNYGEIPDLIRLSRSWGVNHHSFLAVDVSTHAAFGRRGTIDASMALRREDLERFSRVLDNVERDFRQEFENGFIVESSSKMRRLRDYFSAILGLGRFPEVQCNAPRFSAVIGADGSLKPCYFLPAAGRLDGLPLLAALNLPEMVHLRREQRLGVREECARCVCSAWFSRSRIGRMA